MATEKIQLEIGSSFPGKKQMTEAHSSVKQMQNSVRECSEVGKHALGQIASQLNGEFSPALRIGIGLLEEIARGGLWGVMAAAGNAAFQFIINKCNEANEAAKVFAATLSERFSSGVSAVAERFKGLSDNINQAAADAKDMMAVLNGEIAGKAEAKIHQLHIETLQKLTDATSEAAKQVILADEALAAAKIRATATLEQAQNATHLAEQAVVDAQNRRAAAEAALAEITAIRTKQEGDFSGWMEQRKVLQQNIEMAEVAYSQKMIDHGEYMKKRNYWVLELKKFEERYAAEISAHAEILQKEKEASAAIESAKRAEEVASRNVTLAKQKEESASLALERATLDGEAKVVEASRAQEAEIAASLKKSDAEIKKAEQERISAEITKICDTHKVKAAEYIKLYGDSIAEGLTHTEAYGKLQEKLNKELEKRAEAEKDAADGAGGGSGGGKGGSKSKPMYVSLSTSISSEIDKVGGKTWSETQKEARKHHTEMMKDALPLYRAMKGQMPKEQQKLFEQYMMSKYTPEQVKKIWDEAQSKQLIDKAERKRQTKYLGAMLEAMKKQGLG